MSVRFCCDFCDRPLPIKTRGIEGENKKITAELTYPKEVDLKDIFPHLCESCAKKIDAIIVLSRKGMYKKADLIRRQMELNKERREKLGTRG